MINFKKQENKRGFTLVETLVALFIFSISIMAVMTVFSQGISNTNYAKSKMTAEYLSQEGIEYIRNMRDTYVLYAADKTSAWGEFTGKLFSQENRCENGCGFDSDESLLNTGQLSFIKDIRMFPCDNKCQNFSYNSATGQFDFSGDASTTFARTIRVNKIDDNNLKITSEVTFSAGSSTGTVSLSEDLSNWIE